MDTHTLWYYFTDINLAVGRPAWLSSSLHGDPTEARRAVDGNDWDTSMTQGSCIHTDISIFDSKPWLVVELNKTYSISHVEIVNRGDCCSKSKNNLECRKLNYCHESVASKIKRNLNDMYEYS